VEERQVGGSGPGPVVTRPVLKPRVSALLDAAVAEILGAAGAPPTPEEVVWLHSLAERQVLPGADDPPVYLPQPIELCGNLVFYPLTLEAQIWLDEYVRRWWRGDDLPAVAYAMAHCGARTQSPFPRLTHRGRAKATVYGWWWRQRVSRQVVRWAVLTMAGRQELVWLDAAGLTPTDAEAADPLEWGEIIARLSSCYHQAPEMFLRMPESVVVDLYRRAPRMAAQASGLPGGGDDGDAVQQQAFAHFRMVIRHVIAARKAARTVAEVAVAAEQIEAIAAAGRVGEEAASG